MEKYFEELIIDYLTGNLSDSEAARFLEFVHSDEQHRRRFEEPPLRSVAHSPFRG